MGGSLAHQVLALLDKVAELYHRLVLVAAPSGAGKTAALQEVSRQIECPVINVNLEVSKRLLELTARQRSLQLPQILRDSLSQDGRPALLDNTEILFHPELGHDPLRLLQSLSRNRTVVASWNGTAQDRKLTYATPDHPEHRRYPLQGLVVVAPGSGH